MMEKVLERASDDGCTTVWTTEFTLKWLKMVNFMLCIFYHTHTHTHHTEDEKHEMSYENRFGRGSYIPNGQHWIEMISKTITVFP